MMLEGSTIVKRIAFLTLVLSMLLAAVGPPQAGAQAPPPQGGTMPTPGGQSPRPLSPLQQQQKDAQQAQQAQVRALTAGYANAPYNGPGGAAPGNDPAARQAAEQNRAVAARIARGDLTPPPPDTSPGAVFSASNGKRNPHARPLNGPPTRGEEPSHERALRLLGLGALVDLKDLIRWDNSELREAVLAGAIAPQPVGAPVDAPDDQQIELPIGYCSLSSYIWQGGEAWLPYVQGIGFQYCNVIVGELRWQSQEEWLMKCGYYFEWLHLCLQPQYYWFFNPPGQCLNFEPTNFACGPGRYYVWEPSGTAFANRNHGEVVTWNGGTGAGYRDSSALEFFWQ